MTRLDSALGEPRAESDFLDLVKSHGQLNSRVAKLLSLISKMLIMLLMWLALSPLPSWENTFTWVLMLSIKNGFIRVLTSSGESLNP